MGCFLAVSQGVQEPRTIIRYDPPDADGDATLGLVGKAVTFDTGGISIKPALYMEDMKGDMSEAAVLAGLGAIAELGLPVRAIGSSAPPRTWSGAAPTGRGTSCGR